MSQTSFHNRVARIEAKHTQPAPKKRRGFARLCVTMAWIGFCALVAGMWQTGAISSQNVAALVQTTVEHVHPPTKRSTASIAKPIADRNDGARWTSVNKRSGSGGTFVTLSTKNATTRSGGGDFVDYIDMRVEREKNAKNKGRLGFEGQKAHANKKRDAFWNRK